jgi:hypothetical protein
LKKLQGQYICYCPKAGGRNCAIPTRSPGLDDQTVFWNTVRRSKSPQIVSFPSCQDNMRTSDTSRLSMCGLDECQFNSGMIQVAPYGDSKWKELTKQLESRKKEVRTVHANFMIGNDKKKEALQKHDLWLLPHHAPHMDHACAPCKNSLC